MPASTAPLLPTVSIVEQTMGRARRTVAVALVGAALIVIGLLAERLWYASAHDAAIERHGQAQRLAGEVQLIAQRLSLSARLAVATADPRWTQQHDALLPRLDDALARTRALAPAGAAQRFDSQSRAASDELSSLRESAFAALTVGAPEVAHRVLDSGPYQRQTALLDAAISEFNNATVAAAQANLLRQKRRAYAMGVAVLAGGLLLGVALWRRLALGLQRSSSFFLEAEDRIQRLATSDLLTGLANRTALHDAMATALRRAQRRGSGMALLMIDLDRFKPVNDRHGHMIGDLVLKEVAHRLSRCLRGGELRARYGGDEFVVAIEEDGDASAARVVAERIVQQLSQTMQVENLAIVIGASIGIARYPADGPDGDSLLRKADSALYRAKANGRGGVCFYDSSLDEAVAERDALERAMAEGIAARQFQPYYQPIVDLASRRVQSLELLCRWNHPQRGLVAPADFIPLAEQSGQIGALMLSVLDQACVDLARFPPHWRLSINVAPQQMQDATLVPQLLAVLRAHGVPPPRLDVELTETALVADTASARQVMRALKEAGITVTLDDFGTGYSSLCYLAEMSFDKLKIDRSFVRTLHDRPESWKIVDAVIGLSRSLGVQTVAEGVETERDAQALSALGCGLAQGYLFGRPVPADELKLPALEPAPEAALA